MDRPRPGDRGRRRRVFARGTRPAEILGIPKGTSEVGRDADLVVVNPREIELVTAKRVQYKCGWTPFEGMEACFPRAVYLGGESLVEDREPVSEREGRLVHVSR